MFYREKSKTDLSAAKNVSGVIAGVRLRPDHKNDQTRVVIEVLIKDTNKDGIVEETIIIGTLFNYDGSTTVYGRMLAARLAHPDCMERIGQKIRFCVYPITANDRATGCVLRSMETGATLGSFDLKSLPHVVLRESVERWVVDAIAHFGSFDTEDYIAETTPTNQSEEATWEANELPF